MALVDLAEAKAYLRVDTSDEDGVIDGLLTSAEYLCADVARLDSERWNSVSAEPTEEDSPELTKIRALLRTAVMFALGYLNEHREEANHDDLVLTLRSLLTSVREGAW